MVMNKMTAWQYSYRGFSKWRRNWCCWLDSAWCTFAHCIV